VDHCGNGSVGFFGARIGARIGVRIDARIDVRIDVRIDWKKFLPLHHRLRQQSSVRPLGCLRRNLVVVMVVLVLVVVVVVVVQTNKIH
jgi:hypothetical protein